MFLGSIFSMLPALPATSFTSLAPPGDLCSSPSPAEQCSPSAPEASGVVSGWISAPVMAIETITIRLFRGLSKLRSHLFVAKICDTCLTHRVCTPWLEPPQFGMAPKWGISILYLFWPTKWTFACSSNSFNLRDWSYFFAMLTLACLTIGNSLALPLYFWSSSGRRTALRPWGSGLILIALEPLDLLFPCAKTPCSLARTEEGGSLSNAMGGLSYWSGVLLLIPVGHSWFIITVK